MASERMLAPSPSQTRNRKSSPILNVGLSLVIFFALIQVFDPTVQSRIENDIGHRNSFFSPMKHSLEAFARGQTRYGGPTHTFNGSDRVVALLDDAGILQKLSNQQMQEIPQWDQVMNSNLVPFYVRPNVSNILRLLLHIRCPVSWVVQRWLISLEMR